MKLLLLLLLLLTAAATAATATAVTTHTLQVEDKLGPTTRKYQLSVPSSYHHDAADPIPVLLYFHGQGL
jgi:poly(3-hydroxybutyrate) depolymerase